MTECRFEEKRHNKPCGDCSVDFSTASFVPSLAIVFNHAYQLELVQKTSNNDQKIKAENFPHSSRINIPSRAVFDSTYLLFGNRYADTAESSMKPLTRPGLSKNTQPVHFVS
jgi:hypothetical protein